MPAQARRITLPRAARIGIATAVTGVSFALPLVTAMSAQAHTAPGAPAAPAAAASAPAAPAAAQGDASYRVVSGDTLSKIADAKHVEGGWQALYAHNRSVVGANPNLIFPGQSLAIAAQAAPAAPAAPAQKPAAPAAKPRVQVQTEAATPGAQVQVQATVAQPAQAPAAAPVAAASGYVAPLANPVLGEAYGVAGAMWASGHHTGQDFVASTGTPVRAVANGVVVKADNGGAYGNEVEIQLADGKYAQYAHLSSIGVTVGQSVTVGQQLGLSGATGNVTGPHLHFEIRTGPEYGSDIDPVAYLRAHGVAL
ncbi:peptidoglycan DD-metalloendopeptidase family protein [Kitasatospora sp. NPDC059408]|uniref:M23 family metallopeptidase n=1 Tax=Kitasatospora sp. NPDC059408 TaxID=3346823 RepID=UPI0036CF15D2